MEIVVIIPTSLNKFMANNDKLVSLAVINYTQNPQSILHSMYKNINNKGA